MKTRYKGIIVAIALLLTIFVLEIATGYLIFHTGDYGKWNECQNNFNYTNLDTDTYHLTEELITKQCGELIPYDIEVNQKKRNNCIGELERQLEQKQTKDRMILCGTRPFMPAETFRNIPTSISNFMFDGGLQMLIPFGQFQNSILFILICYFIGFYIDKKRK